MFLGLVLGLGQVNQAATLGPPSSNRSANVVGVGATGSDGIVTVTSSDRHANVVGVTATGGCGSITTTVGKNTNVVGAGATASAGSIIFDAAQTTAFLARTSGLSGTETAAYKALINGLVADGTFTLLDALYIFATNTTTTANLNLVSTSFTITANGSPTFTADVGYTGTGSSFLDTGLTPSGSGNWKIGSSSLGVAIQTNDTSSVSMAEIGSEGTTGSTFDYLLPSYGLASHWTGGAGTEISTPSTTSKGMWAGTNTTASAAAIYHNGSATAITSGSNTSTTLPGFSFYILAANFNGASGFSTRQVSAAWIGGGLTGAQYLALANRINTYLASMPAPVNVY